MVGLIHHGIFYFVNWDNTFLFPFLLDGAISECISDLSFFVGGYLVFFCELGLSGFGGC
jgi:hypothetical protein